MITFLQFTGQIMQDYTFAIIMSQTMNLMQGEIRTEIKLLNDMHYFVCVNLYDDDLINV